LEAGCFRSNSPPVVHETVDGETIVVNLDTGSYYDLNHVGGAIFELLNAGMPLAELTTLIAATYDLEHATVAGTVEGFTSRLVEEQLLVPAGGENGAAPRTNGTELPAAFADPVLNKYTDMQELLLLDPVHEVDEAGWPSRA
jgi:hypothetical protein